MQTELFITTPCLNAVGTIDQTIQSVVSQAGPVRVHYHVQDGGSSDGTWERILWWQRALSSGDWPLACAELRFTCHQAPDAGLYDAIVTGFETLAPSDQAFLAWINADDIYLSGAFAFISAVDRQFGQDAISWIGGGVSVIRDDRVVASHDREIPTSVVRAGLCDHSHWHFVQQEGSFFRAWLWRKLRPEQTIRPMRLAGDWNLWRLMAEHAELVQAGRALASFRVRPDQLSATQMEAYKAEIDAILPESERLRALRRLSVSSPPTRLRLESRFDIDALTLVEEAVDPRRYTRYPELFGDETFVPVRLVRRLGRLDSAYTVPVSPEKSLVDSSTLAERLRHIRREGWLQALDTGWQYPAITEEHALRRLEAMGGLPDGLIYVAYPWATLIDHLQANGAEAELQLALFEAFCAELPTEGVKVTVCQHVLMRDFLHLFHKAGIDHIFWSHTEKADLETEAPILHPFPLYPVQLADKLPLESDEERSLLYSFIGARADQYYLTEVRNWILDHLGDRPEGLVMGREAWHYAKIVYRHQIARASDKQSGKLIDEDASLEFRDALSRSIFALCPSGSGPNSIRLWEALGSGAIPVILSDRLALPGDPRLWDKAVVYCTERLEEVATLPERLAALASDPARLETMRVACRQLWDVYGPASFVTDILGMGGDLAAHISEKPLSPAIRRLVRHVLSSPYPRASDAELLLTLVAGQRAARGVGPSLAVSTSFDAALSQARARLGKDHPACRNLDDSTGSPPNEVQPRKNRPSDSFEAERTLFPGPLWPIAQKLLSLSHQFPEKDQESIAHTRDAMILASDIPGPALLSDHHAGLYRLFLNRDVDLTVDDCLSRWSAAMTVEWQPPEQADMWPDPLLARFSSLYGDCRIMWSDAPSQEAVVEALVLGAVPASPDGPGLGDVVPAAVRIDLPGSSKVAALHKVQSFIPDVRLAADWLAARAALRRRLSDPLGLEAARYAIVEAMLSSD